jgi:hypothetical protein
MSSITIEKPVDIYYENYLKFLLLSFVFDLLTTVVIFFTGGHEVGIVYQLLGMTDFPVIVITHIFIVFCVFWLVRHYYRLHEDVFFIPLGVGLFWCLAGTLNLFSLMFHEFYIMGT